MQQYVMISRVCLSFLTSPLLESRRLPSSNCDRHRPNYSCLNPPSSEVAVFVFRVPTVTDIVHIIQCLNPPPSDVAVFVSGWQRQKL